DDLFVLYNEKREIDLQKNIEAFNLVKDDISKHIELAEAWEEEALELINSNKTSLFFQQVNATKDNLIKLIFNRYYKDKIVKNDITKNYELDEKREEEELELINSNKTSLFFQQVNATKDNLIKLIFNSYYQDTRMKPYMNLYNSCLFILNQLDEEVNE